MREMLNSVASTVDALRRLGVGLALDDFGTEHSSMTRLRQLPVQPVPNLGHGRNVAFQLSPAALERSPQHA